MNSRTTTLLAFFFAVGVTSLQLAGFRKFAFVTLALGIATAAVLRRFQVRRIADQPAVIALQAAREMLARGDAFSAIRSASQAVEGAKTSGTRNQALTTLAWAALDQGYVRRAKAALDQIEPRHAVDLHCHAAVCMRRRHSRCGHPGARGRHIVRDPPRVQELILLVELCTSSRHGSIVPSWPRSRTATSWAPSAAGRSSKRPGRRENIEHR